MLNLMFQAGVDLGGFRGERGGGSAKLSKLKYYDIMTRLLGLRILEIPFLRTSVLIIFQGRISLDPL